MRRPFPLRCTLGDVQPSTLARDARVYDLAQPYYVGMPHHPSHPPYLYSMTKKHGDMHSPAGNSSAADAIALGSHVGTHIDGFGHFSCGGKLHGGHVAADVQSYGGGLTVHTAEEIAPIVRRGVLLDAAKDGVLREDAVLTGDALQVIAAEQGTAIEAGDVVLIRTGWAQYWEDATRYINAVRGTPAGPGPDLSGAKWLSAQGVFAAGSDTVAFERVPAHDMPVHIHLLFEKGIHIIEALDLEGLARDRVYEFLFVGAPLKLRGGTGAPLRPLALA
ncbi:MAG: cyclase family protein [Bryobacterales bacterium]|nr:cyclase family protein [Bryobacterales bacterium]